MSQLLSGKNKGRFGAPPEESNRTSPWRAAPLYLLVPLTVICIAVTIPAWLGYSSCRAAVSICAAGGSMRRAETGTISGIVTFTGVVLVVAAVLLVAATLLVKRWPLVVVYSMAILALGLGLYAFLTLNGSISTPAGGLAEIRLPSTVK